MDIRYVRLQHDFLDKLDTYIQSEQGRGASTSREELAILFQIRDSATQTMELLAQAFSPAYENDAERHAAIWRQLREEKAVIDADLFLVTSYGALRLAEADFVPGAKGQFCAGWSRR